MIPIVVFDNETARKRETLVIFGLEDYDHKWMEHTASPKKKTVFPIPPNETAQGMKLWTKSHTAVCKYF